MAEWLYEWGLTNRGRAPPVRRGVFSLSLSLSLSALQSVQVNVQSQCIFEGGHVYMSHNYVCGHYHRNVSLKNKETHLNTHSIGVLQHINF